MRQYCFVSLMVFVLTTCVFTSCVSNHSSILNPYEGNRVKTVSQDQGADNPNNVQAGIIDDFPSYIQSPKGMVAGIDYIPNEIVVGFSKTASIKGNYLSNKSDSDTREFTPQITANAMLFENTEVAEFSRYIARSFELDVVPGCEAYIDDLNFCTYRMTNGRDPQRLAAVLRLVYSSEIKYVQYNQIFRPCYSPNDTKWIDGTLWGMEHIGVETAWDTTKGSGARIAIIDSGIRTASPLHEDLNYISPPGVNLDVVDDDNIPNDANGHGTHVSGTAAALGDNSKGVVGAAYEAELMPLKVIGSLGYATSGSISTAIALARTNGADVINLSLGSYSVDRASFEAALDAWDSGVVVVAAAGNDNTNHAHYPSAYPS